MSVEIETHARVKLSLSPGVERTVEFSLAPPATEDDELGIHVSYGYHETQGETAGTILTVWEAERLHTALGAIIEQAWDQVEFIALDK